MSGQLNYSERYAILSARVAFLEYSQRKKLVNEGRLTSLNIFQQNYDASIITSIRIGEVNTTEEELENYLSAVDLPPNTSAATIPDAPVSLCVIPSDSALTIIFLPGSDGGSPITNYSYSTDGVVFTDLSPDQTTSPLTLSGLTNGTVYTIYLKAINSVGSSEASESITAAPIPSSFDPSSIAGLNVWLDSQNTDKVILTGSQVSAWNDTSAGANNFTAGGGVINYSQPSGINNRPAINFVDAYPTSTYLVKTGFNITPGSNQLTLFMVLSQTGLGTGNSELFYTKDNYTYFDLFNNTNPGESGNLALNARSSTQRDTGQDIITTPPVIVIISVVLSTTNGSVYLNGTVTSVNNTAITGLTLDAAHDWAISAGGFKGFVGEVITYPSALSNSNREKVEAYLAWKWGLQSQLPLSSPWKNSPPTSANPPGAPTLVFALAANTSAFIYYTAGTGSPTNYQFTTDAGTTYTSLSPADILSPSLATGLTNGASATIQFRAYDGNLYSYISNSLSITPSNTALPSPTLYYDPNESSSFPGSGTSLFNIGTYGANTGLIELSVPWITGTGISRKVFNFIGAPTGGYITFNPGGNFGANFTISAWIRPSSTSYSNGIIANGPVGNNQPGFKFAFNNTSTSDGALIFESGNSSGSSWATSSSVTNTITVNTWQHVSVIFNQTTRSALFLLNGNPVGMTDITTATSVDTNRIFAIGCYINGTNRMIGQLGYIKVFNSSLTATQVLADYNNTRVSFGL